MDLADRGSQADLAAYVQPLTHNLAGCKKTGPGHQLLE